MLREIHAILEAEVARGVGSKLKVLTTMGAGQDLMPAETIPIHETGMVKTRTLIDKLISNIFRVDAKMLTITKETRVRVDKEILANKINVIIGVMGVLLTPYSRILSSHNTKGVSI